MSRINEQMTLPLKNVTIKMVLVKICFLNERCSYSLPMGRLNDNLADVEPS